MILIDGKNLAYKNKYTHESLTVEIDGKKLYTGMAYGFIKSLISIREKFPKGKIAICWDGGNSRRKFLFEGYKENRTTKIEIIIIKELQLTEEVLHLVGIPQYLTNNEEADDIIGTLCKKNKKKEIVIVSGDHDMLQLLRKNVSIYVSGKNEKYITKESFIKEYGYHPKYYRYSIMLSGCKSDNIPGIYGIGKGTAAKIMSAIDGKINIRKIKEVLPKVENVNDGRKKLIAEASVRDLKLYLKLSTINKDVELKLLKKPKQDKKELKKRLEELKYKSLLFDEVWDKIIKLPYGEKDG